jgi:hypothetical protein
MDLELLALVEVEVLTKTLEQEKAQVDQVVVATVVGVLLNQVRPLVVLAQTATVEVAVVDHQRVEILA